MNDSGSVARKAGAVFQASAVLLEWVGELGTNIEDVDVEIDHPHGIVRMPLTEWMKRGPGLRPLLMPARAYVAGNGPELPLRVVPLRYRNNFLSRLLIRLRLLSDPWREEKESGCTRSTSQHVVPGTSVKSAQHAQHVVPGTSVKSADVTWSQGRRSAGTSVGGRRSGASSPRGRAPPRGRFGRGGVKLTMFPGIGRILGVYENAPDPEGRPVEVHQNAPDPEGRPVEVHENAPDLGGQPGCRGRRRRLNGINPAERRKPASSTPLHRPRRSAPRAHR